MVAVAWDVFAVSETQRHWSNALASTRMVILWLLEPHFSMTGFQPRRNHREFHDETYSTGPLASPPGGRCH